MKMKKLVSVLMAASMVLALPSMPVSAEEGASDPSGLPEGIEETAEQLSDYYGSTTKIYSNTYSEPGANRNWRDGMVTGNGKNGVVTSGAPYSDTMIYQNIYLIMPSNSARETLDVIKTELEDARQHVFDNDPSWNLNGRWWRDFDYCFHPGPQLRLTMEAKETSAYERWTDYETAEVGVSYTDEDGSWERRTFTSRADDVVITEITQSSEGEKVNMTLSIDNPSSMYKFGNGDERNMQYKKLVGENAEYIAQAAHYPEYENSELKEGGYAGVTQVVTVGGTKEKVSLDGSRDSQNTGEEANPGIEIKDADAVYLITKVDRTHEMGKLSDFAGMESYDLVDRLYSEISEVTAKYTTDGSFDYDAALAPHVKLHSEQFNTVKFSLNASEADRALSTEDLLDKQKQDRNSLNAALVERAYNAGRYAELCCAGYSTSRLGGMWTGEWNPGWRSAYTMDANVNLQSAPMNTGHMTEAAKGYIYFVLRQIDDWMQNAEDTYGMHDAIQVPVNTDGDRAPMIESDAAYPFQYWNAGASWMLLPIYEYWQCYGNQQIPVSDVIDLQRVRGALGVNDGGLSAEEVNVILERGWMDLEQDILRPLLTKQANFWEQFCTPEYYIGTDGEYYHDPDKQELEEGEKYLFIPTYSPENAPQVYNSTITLNATMDIAAAKDGLSMAINMEKAVTGEETNAKIAKWEELLSDLPEYEYDGEAGVETSTGGNGALREWSTQRYTENNNHRHISHLYVAWPAYETQHDEELEQAAKAALANRDRLNTGDNTTGHGWMHHSLISARLKDSTDIYDSILHILSSDIYYQSMMTDHNTNRGSDTYCTDTSIGMVGVINEALAFSNTGEIEILPALPEQWTTGSMDGMMARTRAEIEKLSWDLEKGVADVQIRSDIDQTITLTSGMTWETAEIQPGTEAVVTEGEEIQLTMAAGETVNVRFIREDVSREQLKERIDSARAELDAKQPVNFPVSDEAANQALEDVITAAENVYSDQEASADTIREAAWDLLDALRSFREAYAFTLEASLTEGIYSGKQEVSFSYKDDERVQIHYTLDGSEPTAESGLYEEAIELPTGIVQLKAAQFAAETGEQIGDTLTLNYQCNLEPNHARGKASSTTNDSYSGQGTDRAIDGNSGTRWSSLGGDGSYVLEIDLRGPYTFNSAVIDEYVEVVDQEDHRIEQFELQYQDNAGEWQTAYSFDQDSPGTGSIMFRPDPEAGESHAYYGVEFEPVTTSRVRLLMTATKEVSIWEFALYNNNVERSLYDNVALSKPITASSYDGPTPTENAIDGDWDTRWAAGSYNFPESLTVDLQGRYYVDSIYTLFELPSAFKFIIEYSEDGETWKTYTDCTENEALITENYVQKPIAASYVRITLTGSSDRAWASLWEFQIYGSEIVEIAPQEVTGTAGQEIALPAAVSVTLSSGETKEFTVEWEADSVIYEQSGTYPVTGTVPELDGMVYTVNINVENNSPVSKNTLEYFLNSAKEHLANGDVDDCVQSIKDLFDEAIAEGDAVMADGNATREEVMNASVKLMKAVQAIDMKAADKTDLEMAVELAEMIDLTDYIDAGQQEFTDALAAANAVLADGDAMQAETDNTWNALVDAMANLRLKADKAALEDLLNEVAGLDLTQYTEESAAVFRTALASAQAVLEDDALTEDDQETVDNAVAALMSARDGLTAKADDSGNGSQDGNADVNQGGNDNNNSSGTDGNKSGTAAGSNDGNNTGGSKSGTDSGTAAGKAAKTGDVVPVTTLILLAIISGTAIIAAARRRTR